MGAVTRRRMLWNPESGCLQRRFGVERRRGMRGKVREQKAVYLYIPCPFTPSRTRARKGQPRGEERLSLVIYFVWEKGSVPCFYSMTLAPLSAYFSRAAEEGI